MNSTTNLAPSEEDIAIRWTSLGGNLIAALITGFQAYTSSGVMLLILIGVCFSALVVAYRNAAVLLEMEAHWYQMNFGRTPRLASILAGCRKQVGSLHRRFLEDDKFANCVYAWVVCLGLWASNYFGG